MSKQISQITVKTYFDNAATATYKVRYGYSHSEKGTVLVCDTDQLFGEYGDEIALNSNLITNVA